MRLAGLLIACTKKHSKQGRPFALFTLEDYEGTLDLALFGEDFMKNQHMLQPGTFVYLVGTVQERYRQKDVWELRPQKISLLSEVREKMSRKLLLSLPIDKIDAALADKVEKVIHNYPGQCSLNITITDHQEPIGIELYARNHRINPTNELLDSLSELAGATYRLCS